MRTCATASVVAILGIPLVLTFAACSGGSPSNGTTPDKSSADAKDTKDAPTNVQKDEPKADSTGQTPAADTKPAATAPAAAATMTTAECVKLPELTDAELEQQQGVVMNNAQPSKDAKSDRFTPVNVLIKKRRPSYRCCYDIWSKAHPKESIKALLAVELSPDGTVKTVSVKKEESTASAPEVEPCLAEVTKTITFPKSPSGRDTLFTYPFDFKPR